MTRSLPLAVLYRADQTNRFRGPTNQPPRPNQQMNRIAQERRLISFDRMSDELKYPTDDKQSQRPAPTKEEQRQRHGDHRNPDRVRQTVQRMPMSGFVAVDERRGHWLLRPGILLIEAGCPERSLLAYVSRPL